MNNQLGLALSFENEGGIYMITNANRDFAEHALSFKTWNEKFRVCIAPHYGGKTCLAQHLKEYHQAHIINHTSLPQKLVSYFSVIDNAHLIKNTQKDSFFYLLNQSLVENARILLLSEKPIKHWAIQNNDIISRLSLAPTIEHFIPDRELVEKIFEKRMEQEQIYYKKSHITQILSHCEYSYDAIHRICEAIKKETLKKKKKLTKSLLHDVLKEV